MANQYVAFYEQTVRGVMDVSPAWMFLPVTGKLQPTFAAKDEPRKEFKGGDTALGDSSVIRRESNWSFTLECSWYPGKEVGTLLKHALGKALTRVVTDTSAFTGLLYPVATPYGTTAPLGDTALAFAINTDEEGVTKSQIYGGGRIKSCTISFKGLDDIKLTFEIAGAGAWVGAVDQAATAGVSWPVATPFCTSDALFYIGGSPTRTGAAPDFTALAAGTALPFRPDDLTIKITSGIEDKVKMNGVKGASVSYRSKQFSAAVDGTVDYTDPSAGEFSSADEFKRIFSGPATNNIIVLLDNKQLAGAATANYKAVIDLPFMQANLSAPDRGTEGKTPSMKLSYASLIDSAVGYPLAIQTTDKASAYPA
jgi:hypothetical protein